MDGQGSTGKRGGKDDEPTKGKQAKKFSSDFFAEYNARLAEENGVDDLDDFDGNYH
jgi:hypothetical protein